MLLDMERRFTSSVQKSLHHQSQGHSLQAIMLVLVGQEDNADEEHAENDSSTEPLTDIRLLEMLIIFNSVQDSLVVTLS